MFDCCVVVVYCCLATRRMAMSPSPPMCWMPWSATRWSQVTTLRCVTVRTVGVPDNSILLCLLLNNVPFTLSCFTLYVRMYVRMLKCLQTQLPISYSCPTPFPIPNSSCSAPLRMQPTAFSTTPRATWVTSALTRWPSLAMPWHRPNQRIVVMLLPCWKER